MTIPLSDAPSEQASTTQLILAACPGQRQARAGESSSKGKFLLILKIHLETNLTWQ